MTFWRELLQLFRTQDGVMCSFRTQRARTGAMIEVNVNGTHGKGRLVKGEERK
jgi:hypothetical protein